MNARNRGLSARTRANRANAQKSRGPTSAAGKARSCMNAKTQAMANFLEAPDALKKRTALAEIFAGPRPSAPRRALADRLASVLVTLERIRVAKHAALEHQLALGAADGDEDDSDGAGLSSNMRRFDRYESRVHSTLRRVLREAEQLDRADEECA